MLPNELSPRMSTTGTPTAAPARGMVAGITAWMDTLADRSSRTAWRRALIVYLLVAFFLTVPGLGSTGLVRMEGMLAYVAETMLETGEFLVPELYGEIYTYKPPLVYWLVALSIKLLGLNEWTVRLPGVAASLIMGLTVLALIGRVSKPRVGLVAALAATTGMVWNQNVKLGEFDVVVAASVGIAIAAACYNLAAGTSRSSSWIWLLAYLALAAGCLAKGMPAIMAFGPGLLVAAILTRQTRQLWSRGHLVSAGLFVAIIGAYLALVWTTAGPAAFEQPLAEAQRRGFEWTLDTLGRSFAKPLIIMVAFLPWSLAVPWGLTESKSQGPPDETSTRLLKSASAFLTVGILVFMAVPTHETRYYLPLSVAAAIVSVLGLERLAEPSPSAARFFQAVGLFFGLLVLTLAFAPGFAAGGRVVVAIVAVSTLAVVQFLGFHRPRHRVAYILFAAALCGWAANAWVLRPYRARFRVLSSVAQVVDAELPPHATVWALGEADVVGKSSSLYYYLDHPVMTFHLGSPLPPAGSWVVLTARELRVLEGLSPAGAARLQLVRRVHHPWRLFLLLRVEKGSHLGPSHAPPRPQTAVDASTATGPDLPSPNTSSFNREDPTR